MNVLPKLGIILVIGTLGGKIAPQLQAAQRFWLSGSRSIPGAIVP